MFSRDFSGLRVGAQVSTLNDKLVPKLIDQRQEFCDSKILSKLATFITMQIMKIVCHSRFIQRKGLS